MATGAESYILKNAPIEQLAEAIRLTQAGYFYVDPVISSLILSKVQQFEPEIILTKTELAILELMAMGTDYEAIASSLGTTELTSSFPMEQKTVNTYIGSIINRIYISDLTQKSVKALNIKLS